MRLGTFARGPRAKQFLSLVERAKGQDLPADEILQAAVDATARTMGTEVATLYVYDARADELVLAATRGLPRSAVGFVTLRMGEGLSGRAALQRAPAAVDDVRSEPAFKVIPGFDQSRYLSMLAVPVALGETLLGALNVQTVLVHDYSAHEAQDLEAIAACLAPTLQELLAGDLSLRLRGPSVLSELDGIAAAPRGGAEIGERLVARLRLLFPDSRCAVALLSAASTWSPIGDELTPAERSAMESSLQHGGAHSVVGEAGPLLALPIAGAAGTLGALVVGCDGNGRRASFGTYEAEYIETLATQAGVALDRLRTEGEAGAHAAAPAEPRDGSREIEALTQMVLDDAGLDALVEEAERLCDARLAVVDASGAVIAGELPEGARTGLDLRAGDSFLGRVVAAVPDERRGLLAAAARIIALELSKWKVRFDVETRLRGDVLDLLLQGQSSDERQVGVRAGLAGLDLTRTYVPVMFTFDVAALSASRGALSLRSFERELKRAFGEPPSAIGFLRLEGLLMLVDPAARRTGLPDAAGQALQALRLLAGDLATGAGVGPACARLADYGAAYRQAWMAAQLGMRLRSSQPVEAARLGPFRLLLALDDDAPLRTFVADTLGPLLQTESDLYGAELVRTLEAYHASGERLRQAAEALFIHANTLKYRLARIETLTGRSLSSPSDRLDLYLALYALRLLRPASDSLLPTGAGAPTDCASL
jgi:sugar diacid utilization regulator/putative methionine-R-sulfoxide reductase with GAF domain